MSYSESNGQVTLTMSREDYDFLVLNLAMASGRYLHGAGDIKAMMAFLKRLNDGNPNYTPYRIGDSK